LLIAERVYWSTVSTRVHHARLRTARVDRLPNRGAHISSDATGTWIAALARDHRHATSRVRWLSPLRRAAPRCGDADHSKILVVTSETMPSELARSRDAGADAVLIKPVTPETLLNEVERQSREPPARRPSQGSPTAADARRVTAQKAPLRVMSVSPPVPPQALARRRAIDR
jgi:CheY-like chemotaxis protein